jgi:hypothetical protein
MEYNAAPRTDQTRAAAKDKKLGLHELWMFDKFVPDEVHVFRVFLITRAWETGQFLYPLPPASYLF